LDDAVRNFERVLAAQPRRPDAHFNLGLVRTRQGRHTDAVSSFDQALRLNPANTEAALARADALLALSRWREAIVALDGVLQRHPNVATLWAKRGAAYDQLADHSRALVNLRRADALNPNDPAVLELIGVNAHRAGRLREAIDAFSRAIAAGNDTAEIRL